MREESDVGETKRIEERERKRRQVTEGMSSKGEDGSVSRRID